MIKFIIILFGVTMLFVSSTSRIEGYIKALFAQGICLFLLVILDFDMANIPNTIFLSMETLIIKAVVIPIFLIRIVRKHGILREIEPNIPSFYSLLIASAIFAAGFYISYWSIDAVNNIRPFYFGISISTIVTGLVIIITRKKLITHVMGYMMIENGIFLLSLSIAKEMPFIVSLGVLLDIFIAIYLLGLFATKIHNAFSEVHIDRLTSLKD